MLVASTTSESHKHLLLEDSTYNVIYQPENKSEFLYSAVENYPRDAEKDGKPELVTIWNKVKEDEQNHLKKLREEQVKEVVRQKNLACREK